MPTTTTCVALISTNIFIKKSIFHPTKTAKNYFFSSPILSTVRNKSNKFSSVSCTLPPEFPSSTPPEFPTPQQIPELDPGSFPKEIPEIHTPPEIDPIPPEKVAYPPDSPGPDLPSPDFPSPPVPSTPGPDIPLPRPDTLPRPPDELPPPRPPGIVLPPPTPADILPPMDLYFG